MISNPETHGTLKCGNLKSSNPEILRARGLHLSTPLYAEKSGKRHWSAAPALPINRNENRWQDNSTIPVPFTTWDNQSPNIFIGRCGGDGRQPGNPDLMLVIIPTRIIPGFLLGFGFIFVGLGTGFTCCSLLLNPSQTRLPHFICPPLFLLALHYLRQVWRTRGEPDALSEAAALSPRLMVVLFGVCLLTGLGCGALMAYTVAQGT